MEEEIDMEVSLEKNLEASQKANLGVWGLVGFDYFVFTIL